MVNIQMEKEMEKEKNMMKIVIYYMKDILIMEKEMEMEKNFI